MVAQAEKNQTYVVAVTNTPAVFEATHKLTATSRFVRAALGLHPELAAERHLEMPLFEQMLPLTRYVGEVGLDFVRNDAHFRAIQQKVFTQVVELCHTAGDKILTIHSRRAEREVVRMLGPHFAGRAILHWYSGPLSVAEQAVENGLYFSINPAMIRSKRFKELLAIIPAHLLLTETDGPFVQISNRNAQPGEVSAVVQALAGHWSCSVEEAAITLLRNFRGLLTT
jgi:TatD DNase family protein